MKIAQVICVFPPYKSGMGNSAYKISEALAARGSRVIVFTPNYTGGPQEEKVLNFKVVKLKPWLKSGNGAFLPQLLFKLKNFDVVHLHYPFFGGAEAVWLAKLIGGDKFKLVLHYHMGAAGLPAILKILSLPSLLIKRSLLKRADAIVCASFDYAANSEISEFFKKNKEKFFEVPFGVDVEKFKPADKIVKNDPSNILFVGGLDKAHYFKGVDVLLEALAKMENKNWRLDIIGKGELKSDYEKLAERLSINDQVFFKEKVSDAELGKAYQKSDIFVLPSINSNEAFGLVLLEAMSSGVPVIASALPGVRAVFSNGVEGLLVQPNNASGLKEKIAKLVSDELLRKKMGAAGRKLVLEKYSWKKVGESLEKIYSIILSKI